MPKYIEILEDVCIKIEKVYLGEEDLLNLPIKEFTDSILNSKELLSESSVRSKNEEIFPIISVLSHVADRMKFFNYLRLDYSKYPYLERLVDAVNNFTTRNKLNRETVEYVNLIITIMDEIDRKHLELRYELSYRVLRILLILIVYRNFAEASVVTNFILMQIKRSVRSD